MARILIAEDDLTMRNFMSLALTRAGHSVQTCSDGIDALAHLEKSDEFDLLLADIVMPGLDGIELSQRASALRPRLKVMFITGFAAVALNQKESDSGNPQPRPRVLSKPFHLRDLVRQVESLLAA